MGPFVVAKALDKSQGDWEALQVALQAFVGCEGLNTLSLKQNSTLACCRNGDSLPIRVPFKTFQCQVVVYGWFNPECLYQPYT